MTGRRRCHLLVWIVALWCGRVASADLNRWNPLGPYDSNGNPVPIHALAAAPNTSILYAASDEAVFRSDDGGAHWIDPSDGLSGSRGVLSVAVVSSAPSTVYAGTFAGLYRSTDSGSSWTAAWIREAVYTVALDPLSPSTLYVGTGPMNLDDVSSVFKSTDGGESWTRVLATDDYYGFSSLAIDPVTTENVYAGSYRGQFFRSTNAGTTWTEVLGYWNGQIQSIAIDPLSPSTIYAASQQTVVTVGPGVGSVVKSVDAGSSFSTLPGLPVFNVDGVAVDPRNPSNVFAGADGTVYRSRDAGMTWAPLGDGSTPISLNAFLLDPVDPSHLYVATYEGVYDIELFVGRAPVEPPARSRPRVTTILPPR